MGAVEEARLKDALQYLREADKNTEKGFFKKPDWDIAAQYYEKAGQAFKAGKSYDQSIQAFTKASDAMISATSMFMAARAMENAGNIAQLNLGQSERAAELYKRASDLYMRNMTPDRAAEMLEKCAKVMEPLSADAAIDYYLNACMIYESEDRARYATETFKKTIALLVKHRRFDKATEMLQALGNIQKDTPNKMAYYKTLLSIIIVQLAAGDEVEAGRRFQAFCSVEGFVHSEESAVAHAMLDAFDHRDQAYYNQAAARQHVGFLDNEIARLARGIVVADDLISGGGYVDAEGSSQSQRQHQQPFYPQQQGPPRPLGPGSGPMRQPSPYQQVPKQPSYPQSHSPLPPQPYQPPLHEKKDVYHGRPISQSSDYRQQPAPASLGSSRPSSVIAAHPPPYSNERSDSDWRALTEKQPLPGSQPPPIPPRIPAVSPVPPISKQGEQLPPPVQQPYQQRLSQPNMPPHLRPEQQLPPVQQPHQQRLSQPNMPPHLRPEQQLPPAQQPYQQRLSQPNLPPQQRLGQQPGAPPTRNYYDEIDVDDDDGLL
ncbi:hypothetical protein BGZ98_006351 [Dissophora globulifera]|nr:hypothetical protein BGZ98_006351 [Dissophora globulifera]